MIATHSPKIMNAKIKQSAIRATVSKSLPKSLIHSGSVSIDKQYWACPRNAADMANVKDEIDLLFLSPDLADDIPDLTDNAVKQVLLPTNNWVFGGRGGYISTSPVQSMGVLNEVSRRLFAEKLKYKNWLVQPTPAARANHGELITSQRGNLILLVSGPAKIAQSGWRGDFVELTATVSDMNVSGGMVAAGWPAITAIGGMAHAVERETGQSIQFAIGMKSASWRDGYKMTTQVKSSSGLQSAQGRVKGNIKGVVSGFSAEEITASAEIVLLLRSDGELTKLEQAAQNIHRISGGSMFDVNVRVRYNGRPPEAAYLKDASADIDVNAENDPLDQLLDMYGKSAGTRQFYTLNMVGYGWLEDPQARKLSRNGYKHCWSEPLFTAAKQSAMDDDCWWQRQIIVSGVVWEGMKP